MPRITPDRAERERRAAALAREIAWAWTPYQKQQEAISSAKAVLSFLESEAVSPEAKAFIASVPALAEETPAEE